MLPTIKKVLKDVSKILNNKKKEGCVYSRAMVKGKNGRKYLVRVEDVKAYTRLMGE